MIVQVYPNTHLKFILGLSLLCMLNIATTHLGFGLRKLIIGLNDFEWKGVIWKTLQTSNRNYGLNCTQTYDKITIKLVAQEVWVNGYSM